MKEFQTNFQIKDLPINKIICGDCKIKMQKYLPDNCIDLIYLDPPFFSGRDYEVIWKDGSEIRSFEDTEWYHRVCQQCSYPIQIGFIFCPRCGSREFESRRSRSIEAYVFWLKERLLECYRVLKDTGSIFVHLDWHAVHHIRLVLDEIFGEENFRNEIIWHYISAPESKYHFGRKHDNILFYAKSNKAKFKVQRVPHSPNTPLQRVWRDKVYPTNPNGKALDDVWFIPALQTNSKERCGYPTQKPLDLLKRILISTTARDDLVLDPFAGCGTTLVAATMLKRNWIGIDISPTSCRLVRQRLLDLGYQSFEIIQDSSDPIRLSPIEFRNWVIQKEGLQLSKIPGVDAFTFTGNPVWIKAEPSDQDIRQWEQKSNRGIIYTLKPIQSKLEVRSIEISN